jgi:transcriptional regulator with XRE-family HTH domain
MNFTNLGDQQIQRELGSRLHQVRLQQNISQMVLAQRAGIARRTLIAAEAGEGVALGTLIAILRELELLDRLDYLVPEPTPSPMQLVQMKGRVRQRASKPRKATMQSDRLQETPKWKWKE